MMVCPAQDQMVLNPKWANPNKSRLLFLSDEFLEASMAPSVDPDQV